jgi:ABC-type protease/lipase transport system fused ATPase/permease subunit
VTLPSPTGRLSVQSVGYRPQGADQPTLAGVSLELAAGEALAVIGPSGSGKSTLARLLVGVWRPGAGAVRLDGADLGSIPRSDIGPSIGYVPQDVELFAGTVAENIARLGEVDSERVVLAAKRARVHDMILSLPQGFETVVDPHSPVVSPGQRQRIALARALYGSPKLLVLDEPNSNLDGDGELALAVALRALRGEVTTITITHRTALVQQMDKMLVLDAGRVRHFGTVAEVLAALSGDAPRAGAQVVAIPRTERAAGGGQ